MTLPKISSPIFLFFLTSTNKSVNVRPMLSREEKILLMAKQSGEPADIYRAIKQVCNNCIVDKDVDIDKWAMVDLEFLFVKLQSMSVTNMVKLSFIDNEDQQKYDFDVDLNDVIVKNIDIPLPSIKLDTTYSLMIQWPRASLYSDEAFLNAKGQVALTDILIGSSIRSIVSKDTSQPFEGTQEELREFIDNLSIPARNELIEFFQNVPSLYHSITYKNQKGTERKIELTTLNDFFPWH